MIAGRLTALALAGALAMTGCGATRPNTHELVVGSRPGVESMLLADIYTGALRSYGFPARSEQAPDPLTKLDSGAFVVVPGFTGRVLQRFQPDTTVRSDAQVYKAMVGALPEGIAAGDYTTAAEDKPALAVTESTAKSWGGTDLSAVPQHCDGLVDRIDRRCVDAVGGRQLPAPSFSRIPRRCNAFRRASGPDDYRGLDHQHRPGRAGRPGRADRRQAGAGAGRKRGAAVSPQRADRSATAGGQRGGGCAGHRRAGRDAPAGDRRRRPPSGRRRVAGRTPARALTRRRLHPAEHGGEQPLVSGTGDPHDQVQHDGVLADQHPGLVLADRFQDDLGRPLRGGAGQPFVEELVPAPQGPRPSAVRPLRAIAVLMPPGCTEVTFTGSRLSTNS